MTPWHTPGRHPRPQCVPSATSPSVFSDVETLFQETEFQEAEFQEALFHDAEFQEALFHDAEFQDAEFHDAEFHDAEFHDAEFHEAFAVAALFHDALLKLMPLLVPVPPVTMNASRAAFGFGGADTPAASEAWIVPTPPASPTPAANGLAVTIRAPFTWSGVQSG